MRNEKDYDKDFDSIATDTGTNDFLNDGVSKLAKARDFKGSIKKLLGYIGKYKLRIVFVFICVFIATAFAIASPIILGNATQLLVDGSLAIAAKTGGIDFTALTGVIITLVLLYVGSAVFGYIQGRIVVGIGVRVAYELRRDIQSKIARLPFSYFDKKTYGEVLSRITNDVDVVASNLYQCINEVISSGITIIGYIVMMFVVSWQMAIAALLILPVSFFIAEFIAKKSIKHFKTQQEYLGHVNGHIEEIYTNHTMVKMFNAEQESEREFTEYNKTLYRAVWRAQFLSGTIQPSMQFVNNLGFIVVCVLGGFLVVKGSLNIGGIQAFIQYMKNFGQPIQQLANISSVLQSLAASSERVFEFLGEEEETEDVTKPVAIENVRGNVEFKNVHFGYNKDKIIINNFSAKVSEGQKVAIVGPTGAGKTTMVKLLMRFYDINSGAVYVDGVNIAEMRREDLRSVFGMVLQDTWTFNGTIMDNIRYGRLDASDSDVINAAKSAQVDHFVRTLPDGYNTVLDEESNNISIGQKQLITIARAFLANPKVLILDEATSSVDTRTEILIQGAMSRLMHGRTSFVIAHRLSTIKDADLILVMNNGDIVEQGTHNELLSRGGFYYKLYYSQFEQIG